MDTATWHNLLPLTYTRSIADIRLGIFKIIEKWQRRTESMVQIETQDYLQKLYPSTTVKNPTYINSAVLPNAPLVSEISQLNHGESLYNRETWIASCGIKPDQSGVKKQLADTVLLSVINHPEDIFLHAGEQIKADLELIKKEKQSIGLSPTNTVVGDNEVFISAGARVECSIINTTDGPVYIGSGAEVMEGCMIRAPFTLGDHSVLKMGARIYPNTSIGPHCKIGGEVKNSVILGYSNKAHDGYMGNSVIGEWCNWGADTNNSNMKNNYKKVKLWDYTIEKQRNTDEQFVGLIMGDHSKTGINTMFNTGTVLGVSSNVYGSGFPDKFIPSFSWGGATGIVTYQFDKAIETAVAMEDRRGIILSDEETEVLRQVYKDSSKYRGWE